MPTHATPMEEQSTLSVRARMILLLAITVSAFAVAFFFVQHHLNAQLNILVHERVSETTRVLQRVLELRSSGASVHADDYTRWDDFVAFARKPDPKWAQINLTESINTFALDVAWVLDDHFRLIYTANPKEDPALAKPPLPPSVLAHALRTSPVRHFYSSTPAGLLEIWTSSIQPSSDFERKVPAAGYYVAGRLWSPARITELSSLVDGDVTLAMDASKGTGSTASSKTGQIRIVLPLTDVGGAQVAALDYTTIYSAAPRVHAALHLFLLLMICAALLLFAGVSLALTRWVAQPLVLITGSLRSENPSLLYRLMVRDDEFGRLARLVRDFFAQRLHLIEAREATEAVARAKEQFLANISHELRTPIHGIISFSRFGVDDAENGPRKELLDYFQQIASCGTTLLSLLDDLLDLAKFESGRMRLEFAPLTLRDVTREAAAEFGTLYRERQLQMEFEIEPNLDPVVADRMRLRQVLRNLLSNAGKFTPSGGQVGLRVTRAGSMARVVVEDSGKGIPAGELEKVFDRFSQASNSGPGGTGLGLPLCREIIQSHGGRIWAENRTPNGTRMIFEVPFGGPSASVAGTAPEPESSDGKPGKAAA